ncbi:MAG: DNA-processing protein DprA [Puniceicoccales bacterium]|jgi:predicted Rossmann fold nucleotide-binding protein DprA/Smf involved in DNA uptake|nr:DNA-processing protein DprA [Puniceicoccales bacterium]
MTAPLSLNTQAILLLTAPLLAGRREGVEELLSLGDYNRLARSLREAKLQPADLLGTRPAAKEAIAAGAKWFGLPRLEKLLARGFLLSQAVERWSSRAIWVVSRADPGYPRRLKAKLKEDAPPVLYGCGDATLLNVGGLAVVGSRHIDDALIEYAENTGRLAAQAGLGVISGGAKGIDRAAMSGGLKAGGVVIGVLADTLERAALARDNREALMERQLVIISPYDPAAGFNVGHAMQRNKLIYALADASLVVSSDYEKGGTWTGAVEQLDRLRFGPLFVRSGADAPTGNLALLKRGAMPWPEPVDAPALMRLLTESHERGATIADQEELPLSLHKEQAPYGRQDCIPLPSANETLATPAAIKSAPVATMTANSSSTVSAAVLWQLVQELLRRELCEALTEEEIAARLGVNKAQAKTWLKELLAAGTLEKVKKSKPVRYRVVGGDRLSL